MIKPTNKVSKLRAVYYLISLSDILRFKGKNTACKCVQLSSNLFPGSGLYKETQNNQLPDLVVTGGYVGSVNCGQEIQ